MAARHTALVLAMMVGCGAETPQSAPTRRAPERHREPPADGACADVTAAERVRLEEGQWFASATGLAIRFEGASHDAFEGGATDLVLSLALSAPGEEGQRWMPSALAPPRYEALLGYCVRVVEASVARVALDVAPIPAGAPSALPRCEAPSAPRLENYAQVADERRYVVDVTRDATTGEWRPTPTPEMPHHHASRLSWRGLRAHPELMAADEASFVIEILSHSVEEVPGERAWRAEYIARVIEACAPAE